MDDDGANWRGNLLSAALTWATAGWPVLPIKPAGKTPLRRTTAATSDPDTIRRWWSRWPAANVGVNVTRLNVIVLDRDGPVGLTTLGDIQEVAGVCLPSTFVTRTGREDGGEHYFYRSPDEYDGDLHNVSGRVGGPLPGIDLKVNGYVVVPPSQHDSGRIYTTDAVVPPSPTQIAVLPDALFAEIARRVGRRVLQGQLPVRSPVPKDIQTLPPSIRRRLDSLLDDVSDGRDARTFRAVLLLVRNTSMPDHEIAALVLDRPLGSKARESGRPEAFLAHKITSARRAASTKRGEAWDAARFAGAVDAARLGSAAGRVLDVLAVLGRSSGVVTRSLDRLGIDSALSPASVHTALKSLAEDGWVEAIEAPSAKHKTATTYRLQVPSEQILNLRPPAAPPPLDGSWHQDLALLGNDAFRPASGSLHREYRVLRHLRRRALSVTDAAHAAGVSERVARRDLRALVAAGVAVGSNGGWRLARGRLDGHLRRVAIAAGTSGARRAALGRYREKCIAWAVEQNQWSQRVNDPVTETWRQAQFREIGRALTSAAAVRVRAVWEVDGRTSEDLVTYVVDAYRRRLTEDIDLSDMAA